MRNSRSTLARKQCSSLELRKDVLVAEEKVLFVVELHLLTAILRQHHFVTDFDIPFIN